MGLARVELDSDKVDEHGDPLYDGAFFSMSVFRTLTREQKLELLVASFVDFYADSIPEYYKPHWLLRVAEAEVDVDAVIAGRD